MINRPSPVALLLQASETTRLRLEEKQLALLNALRKFKGNILEAREAPEVCEARIADEDAMDAYSTQACRVLEETKLVLSTIEEIEALSDLLRRAAPPPNGLAMVEVQGEGPSVAAMRAASEGQGFILRDENRYLLPDNFLPASDVAAPVTRALAPVHLSSRLGVGHRSDFGGIRRGKEREDE